MKIRNRKNGFAGLLLAAAVAVLALTLAFACAPRAERSDASADTFGWTPTVRYLKTGGSLSVLDDYVRLTSGDGVIACDGMYVFVEFTDSALKTDGSTFYYYCSGSSLSDTQLAALSSSSWTQIRDEGTNTLNDGTDDYIYQSDHEGQTTYSCYYYFARRYSVTENGKTVSYTQRFPSGYYIRVNTAEITPGIYSVSAAYLQGSAYASYKGEWLASALRFSVTTQYMYDNNAAFDTQNELLYYSVDGGAHWVPMTDFYADVSGTPLKGATVLFKDTDISKQNAAFYTYGETGHTDEYKVNLDPYTPTFSVAAVTADSSGASINYTSGAWTSSAVVFSISNESSCNSKITYYYSESGAEYTELTSQTLTEMSTKSSVRFRAQNQAGSAYSYGTSYAVNIDKNKPNANISASTPDPDETAAETPKVLVPTQTADGLSFGYANGKITIYVYNRDAAGNKITNASGATFYYQSRAASGTYSNTWTKMTEQVSGAEQCFTVSDSVVSEMCLTKYFKFYIKSGAGLSSSEKEITFTLVKSVYAIELDGVTASVNAAGWISDKAVVNVIVPTDSALSGGSYSAPTTAYTFYYVATDGTNEETSAVGRAVSFSKEEEGFVYWTYQFDLVASANSMFYVYARNAAGKKSANTETTNEKIAIDVLDPVYDMTAYIYTTDTGISKEDYVYLDVNNPGWVNGSIVLSLKVKVGVSGVYLKRLNYATDSNGNILRDKTTGAIVWQEENSAASVDETVTENDDEYYCYYLSINKDDAAAVMMSRDYKFRIYTGSGIYKEITFRANIDTSDVMKLASADFTSGEKTSDVAITDGSGIINMSERGFDVCSDTTAEFSSSIDSAEFDNHYSVYYRFFDWNSSGDILAYAATLTGYNLLTGDNLLMEIEENKKGTIYAAVYAESAAVGYDGAKNKSGYYVFELSYNTVNLIIGYEISAISPDGTDVGDEMEGGKWVSGYLDIALCIYINTEGDTKADESYSFDYMLISGNPANIGAAIAAGTWLGADGTYDDDGSYYRFTLNFADASFNGRLAFSVRNGAGYRNTQTSSSAKTILIDNTVPSIDEAIVYQTAETGNVDGLRAEAGTVTVSGTSTTVEVLTYYSTKEIYFQGVTDSSRAGITYAYRYLGTGVASNSGVWDENNQSASDFKKLSTKTGVFAAAGITIEAGQRYYVAYYAVYAVNDVGTEAEGASVTDAVNKTVTYTRVYCFVCDVGTLVGSLQTADGSSGYIDRIGMVGYIWVDKATITVKSSAMLSGSYVKYQFSVDDGETWYVYLDGGTAMWYDANDVSVDLIFSASSLAEYEAADGTHPFENGVSAAFLFRAVTKAGAVKTFDKIYIAIDETTPDFDISAVTSKGVNYEGGSTDSFSSGDEVWTSGPIKITVDMTTLPSSGVTLSYYLTYLENGNITSTKNTGESGKELKNYTFTTDMLDGFNMNRDAVLHITATSNSGGHKSCEKEIRLSVDQVIPDFTLTGQAYNDVSSVNETITSGQWTNRNTVAVSKAAASTNVSGVTYTYIYSDSASSEETEYPWHDEEGSIVKTNSCVLSVTALSGAGLVCTREFVINIDTVAPIIKFDGNINVIDGENYYIDLKVYVEEANIEICEYITVKGDTRGFAFDPNGYILSTSSVDNSVRYDSKGNSYRGYVKIYVKDYAGNTATFTIYVLPFALTVNNITLSDEDLAQVDSYDAMLSKARAYMESNRVSYFENLISRLRDRISTLQKEIKGYQDYLEKLANRSSFELKSDYDEMLSYKETFNDYEVYGNAWIQTAITGDSSSKYYAYYQNFLTQFGKLKTLMDKVESVESDVIALPAINMVEREDYEDILRVYDEYNDLTMDQRACFTSNLYNKLTDLKESCEVLLLTDEELGVSVDGDFAPGATISVTEYDDTTDTYTNAQSLLAETVSSSSPRTIVSVCRIALDGAYSQTSASDIEVTLPIPSEYQNYIYFSVYELSDDGSVKLVPDTEVEADGKSVAFSTDALTTYVLCVKADMQKTDTSDNTYGTILGLDLDVKMIRYLIYGGAALFGLVLIVVIILGIRNRRFLNSYNRAYRNSIYRKGVKGIPKGNKVK